MRVLLYQLHLVNYLTAQCSRRKYMDGSVGKKSDVRITQVNLEAMLGFERYIGIPSSWPLARSSKTSIIINNNNISLLLLLSMLMLMVMMIEWWRSPRGKPWHRDGGAGECQSTRLPTSYKLQATSSESGIITGPDHDGRDTGRNKSCTTGRRRRHMFAKMLRK